MCGNVVQYSSLFASARESMHETEDAEYYWSRYRTIGLCDKATQMAAMATATTLERERRRRMSSISL